MITLHKEQQKYWDTRSNYNVIDNEPRRWGKTTLLYYVAADQLTIPGRKILFLSSDHVFSEQCFRDFRSNCGLNLTAISNSAMITDYGSRIHFSHKIENGFGFHVLLADDVNRIRNYRPIQSCKIIWETYSQDEIITIDRQQELLNGIWHQTSK